MSDPASRADADGVLSSIRRLVDAERPGPGASAGDRFVLTDALRVDAADGGNRDTDKTETDTKTPELVTDPETPVDLGRLVRSELLRAVDDGDARAETETPPAPDSQPAPVTTRADTAQVQVPQDPEALRVLVAEIVRQELQGALGERITRNVRKLVRREIHRVLLSQELD